MAQGEWPCLPALLLHRRALLTAQDQRAAPPAALVYITLVRLGPPTVERGGRRSARVSLWLRGRHNRWTWGGLCRVRQTITNVTSIIGLVAPGLGQHQPAPGAGAGIGHQRAFAAWANYLCRQSLGFFLAKSSLCGEYSTRAIRPQLECKRCFKNGLQAKYRLMAP